MFGRRVLYVSSHSELMRPPEVTPLLHIIHPFAPTKTALLRLLLLLFLWSQASFAVHQHEHDVEDVGESCAVCLQFERSDDVVPDAHVSSPAASSATLEYIGASAVCLARPAAPYLSRASP